MMYDEFDDLDPAPAQVPVPAVPVAPAPVAAYTAQPGYITPAVAPAQPGFIAPAGTSTGAPAQGGPRTLGQLMQSPEFMGGSSERRKALWEKFKTDDLPLLAQASGIELPKLRSAAEKAIKPTFEVKKSSMLDNVDDLVTRFNAAAGAGMADIGSLGGHLPGAVGQFFDEQTALMRKNIENYRAKELSDNDRDIALRNAERIADAAEKGTLSKVWQGAANAVSNPLLTLADLSGGMAPMALAAGIGGLAGGAIAAGTTVAPRVAALAKGLSTGASLTTGAAMGAGAVRGQMYDMAHSMPWQQLLASSPQAAELAKTHTEAQVRQILGSQFTAGEAVGAVGGALDSALLGKFPGVKGLGAAIGARAPVTAGVALGAGIGAGGAGISQAGVNLGLQNLDPTIPTFQGVPEAVGAALPGGGLLGGAFMRPRPPHEGLHTPPPAADAGTNSQPPPPPQTPSPPADSLALGYDAQQRPAIGFDPRTGQPFIVDSGGVATAATFIDPATGQVTSPEMYQLQRDAATAAREANMSYWRQAEAGVGPVQESLQGITGRSPLDDIAPAPMTTHADLEQVRQQALDTWIREQGVDDPAALSPQERAVLQAEMDVHAQQQAAARDAYEAAQAQRLATAMADGRVDMERANADTSMHGRAAEDLNALVERSASGTDPLGVFDADFAQWKTQNPRAAALAEASGYVQRARERVTRLSEAANALAAVHDADPVPVRAFPDLTANETRSQLESLIKEKRNGQDPRPPDDPSGGAGQQTPTPEAGAEARGAGDARSNRGDEAAGAGTARAAADPQTTEPRADARRGAGRGADTQTQSDGQSGPVPVQPRARSTEGPVRQDGGRGSARTHLDGPDKQPARAGADTPAGDGGAAPAAAGKSGNRGQSTGAGTDAGRTLAAAGRATSLVRKKPTSAKHKQENKRPEPADDRERFRKQERAEWEAAAKDWDEEYGIDKNGDVVPFKELSAEHQQQWVDAHRDPSAARHLNNVVDDIIGVHKRNKAHEAAQRVAEQARRDAEFDGSLRELRGSDDARDKVGENEPDYTGVDTLAQDEAQRQAGRDAMFREADSEPHFAPAATGGIGRAMGTPTVRALIDRVRAKLGTDADVRVVDGPQDVPGLRVPGDQQVSGVTMPDGTIYLFGDHIRSPTEALRTLVHELLHRGTGTLFPDGDVHAASMGALVRGDAKLREYAQAWRASDHGLAVREAWTGTDAEYHARSIEEGLARMAEDSAGKTPPVLGKFMDLVSNALERAGLPDMARAVRGQDAAPFIRSALKRTDGDSAFARRDGTAAVADKVRAAIQRATVSKRSPSEFAESANYLLTGQMPLDRSKGPRSWPGRITEAVYFAKAPVLKWLGERNHPIYRALMNAENRVYRARMHFQRDMEAGISRRLAKSANKANVTFSDYLQQVGDLMRAQWAEIGNKELFDYHTEQVRNAQDKLAALEAEAVPRAQSAADKVDAKKQLRESQQWLDMYAQDKDRFDLTGQQRRGDEKLTGGLSDAEARWTIDTLKQRPHYAALEKSAAEMREFFRGHRDRLLRQQAEHLHEQYLRTASADAYVPTVDEIIAARTKDFSPSEYFVPTSGLTEQIENASQVQYPTSGLAALKNYHREGRSDTSENPVVEIVANISKLIDQTEKQPLLDTMTRFAGKDAKLDISVAKQSETVSTGRAIPHMRAATFVDADGKVGVRLVRERIVLKNEHAADALLGTNKGQPDAVMKAFGKYTRLFQFFVTRAQMIYAPHMAIKDGGERWSNIISHVAKDYGVKVNKVRLLGNIARYTWSPDNLRAAWNNVMHDTRLRGGKASDASLQAIREIEDNAGFMSRNTYIARSLEDLEQGMVRDARMHPIKFRDALNKWAEAFEEHSHLAAYRALRDEGLSPKDASLVALESLNFNQTGAAVPKYQSAYPFLGSRMTGGHHVLRGLRTKEGLALRAAKTMMYLGIYSALGVMWGDTDDPEATGTWMENVPGHTIMRYIPIGLPGSKDYIKVPIPYGQEQTMWNTAVALHRYLSGKWTAKEAMGHVADSFMDEISPLSPGVVGWDTPVKKAMSMMMPEPLRAWSNIANNVNDFGSPLHAELRGDRPAYMQGKTNTGPEWTWAAQQLHDYAGINAAPEAVREFAEWLLPFIPFAQMDKAKAKEGADWGDWAAAGVATNIGLKRLSGSVDKPEQGRAIELLRHTRGLMSKATEQTGDPRPRLGRNGDTTAIKEWLDRSELTEREKEQVLAGIEYERASRASSYSTLRRTGGTRQEAEELTAEAQKNFLRKANRENN